MKAALMLCTCLLAACAVTPTKSASEKFESAQKIAASEGKEPPEKSLDSIRSVFCRSGGETRKLVSEISEKSCEVIYERNGEKTVAASAQNDPTHCEKVVDRIRGNLEKAGFKCQR
jgi:hypothetical protein